MSGPSNKAIAGALKEIEKLMLVLGWDDRRALQLSLTAKGRRLYAQGLQAASARNDALMAALTKRERRFWDHFLARLQTRAELLSETEAREAVVSEGIP